MTDLGTIRVRDVLAFRAGTLACGICMVAGLLWVDITSGIQRRLRA
jgi:hypothetical protein